MYIDKVQAYQSALRVRVVVQSSEVKLCKYHTFSLSEYIIPLIKIYEDS